MGMTIKELITQIEVERDAAIKREQRARREVEVILATAQQEGRSGLTEDEDSICEQHFAVIEDAKRQQDAIARKLARAKAVEAEEMASEQRIKDLHNTDAATKRTAGPAYEDSVRIGNEERTYHRGNDPTGRQFLADVVKGFTGDARSQSRLSQHMREEEVERSGTYAAQQIRSSSGFGTAAFTGLVVPQYILDLVAPAVANLRPFADAMNRHPLPADGMTVNISRITTSSSAGLQTNQLSTVLQQDMADTLLTANIQTFAGYSLVSRQAIERGAGIEDQVMQDMLRQMYTNLDYTIITQNITGGVGLIQSATDNADSTATASQTVLYGDIIGAASKSATAVRGIGIPDLVVMHPRRWYWMQAALVSVWPMINGAADTPTGQASQNYTGGVGRLPCGLAVIADANMPTTGEKLVVGPRSEAHLWEDSGNPVFIRAEQPSAAQLGVQLVCYEYAAYTFGRYANAFQSVSGTTLMAAPTGF